MTVRALAFFVLVAGRATAQASTQVPPVSPREPVISLGEAATLGVATAGAALLVGRDQHVGVWARTSSLQHNQAIRSTMTGARLFGERGVVAFGAALWAGGELAGDRVTAIDGIRVMEAFALSGAITYLVKGVAGRARPDTSPGNARDFAWGRGFFKSDEFRSFPSGHTTAAFAIASAMSARVARRSPQRAGWLGPLLYGAATLTGLSRIYDDRHWASDVVLGAGIGTVTGLLLVRRLDRHTPAP